MAQNGIDGEVIPSSDQQVREAGAINALARWLGSYPLGITTLVTSAGLTSYGYWGAEEEVREAFMWAGVAVPVAYVVWMIIRLTLLGRRDARHAQDVENGIRADMAEEDMRSVN